MNSTGNGKPIIFLASFIVLFAIYKNSWLPGAKSVDGIEYPIIISLCFIIFLLTFDFFFVARSEPISILRKYTFPVVLMCLLSISIFTINFQEVTKGYSLMRMLVFFSYYSVFFVLVPKYMLSEPSLFRGFFFGLSLLSFVTAILGILFVFSGVNSGSNYSQFTIAYVVHPNYVSFIYNYGIMSTIYFFIVGYKRSHSFSMSLIILASIVLQVMAILFTYSRGGILGLFAGIFIFLALVYRKKIVLILPLSIGLVASSITYFFKAKGTSSFFSRLALLFPAYLMIKESSVRFLWGYGITNTFDVYRDLLLEYGVFQNVNNPHNSLVSMVLMFGVLFTVVFCVFLFLLLLGASKKALRTQIFEERVYFSFLISSLIALLIHSLFESSPLMPEFFSMQLILLFIGLLFYAKDASIMSSFFQKLVMISRPNSI